MATPFHESSKKVLDAIEAENKAEDQKAVGVLGRLMNRLQTGYVEVPFEDSQGSFTIQMRKPSPAQRRRLWQIQQETTAAVDVNDEEKLKDLDGELTGLFGALCVDSRLNADFWRRGEGFDVDVPTKLLKVALGLDPLGQEDAKFFRGHEAGA